MKQNKNDGSFKKIEFILAEYYQMSLLNYSTLNSYQDENYLVFVKNNNNQQKKYVLKLNVVAKATQIEAQNSVMQHLFWFLKQEGVYCSLPIKSSQGKYYHEITFDCNKYFIRLFQFIQGELLYQCSYKNSAKAYEHFGKVVGLIIQQLQKYKAPEHMQTFYRSNCQDVWYLNNTLKIREYLQYISNEQLRQQITDFLDQFEKIKQKLKRLPLQIIHADLHNQNVFVEQKHERVSGVIDFGMVHQSCALFQLAIAMCSSMHHKDNNIQACKSVFKGYYSVQKISEQQVRLLYYLINARNCTEIVMNRYQKSIDHQNQYLLDCEDQMIASFREITQIGLDKFVQILLEE